jgi:para-aminobenzoate synthetase/4-amino-4-deoxychorismate lyase
MPTSHSTQATPTECFALLDDHNASSSDPRSRLYTHFMGALTCTTAAEFPSLIEKMQRALQQGQHALVLFSYELGAEMHGIAQRDGVTELAQVLLFNNCDLLSAEQVSSWLAMREKSECKQQEYGNASVRSAGIAGVHTAMTEAAYTNALNTAHAYISAGDTYQVNFTYRIHFDAFGSLFSLYRRLRERQPVPYGALIVLPHGGALLSMSPELFVRHENGHIIAQPMKGTAAATGDAEHDEATALALSLDTKNRAENLMIVDLLRNDLGRIAKTGSVNVPQMFDVKRYSSVLQMTSTIHAQLRENISLAEVFSAIYPCGSITGAPKRRTMQIIRALEHDERGIYTGAIGWFDPPNASHPIGNFCLSVPIRTLMLQAPNDNGVRIGKMGVGSGIVFDSNPKEEYAECLLKARFLTGLSNDFCLFETMYATRSGGCRHLDLHLNRLRSSADYFNFTFDENHIRQTLQTTCGKLQMEEGHRVRLSLSQSGQCSIQTAPIHTMTTPVRVLCGTETTQASDLFLRHKTTIRNRYDQAWRTAEEQGAFDMLFFNTNGELTEGARSNVFIKLQGRWYTPPLSCGVLPGVMRTVLLADTTLQASERPLSLDHLRAAEEIMLCNALRGALPAVLD